MKSTAAAALLIFAIIGNLWFATAKPFPLQLDTDLSEEAVIEFLNKISREMGGSQSEDSEQIDWPDKVDPPSSDQPGTMQSDNVAEGTPMKDEEKINEENGVSRKPNVFGDLVLSPEQQKQLISKGDGTTQGHFVLAKLWPNGVVPYWIDVGFPPHVMDTIKAAMNELMQRSCISFVPWTFGTPYYIHFIPGQGCYSALGMITHLQQGQGQYISIGPGCDVKGIVQHELLHALGRIHEQSRLDRDTYVDVLLNHVQPDQWHNFEKMQSNTNFLPYDYSSIMHYGNTDYSVNSFFPTIIPKVHNAVIGQRLRLSDIDLEHVRRMYNCPLVPFNSEQQSVESYRTDA